MKFYWLILGSLAAWRITHLLYAEDGPWAVFARLRKWLGDGFWGGLLDCFYCLSLWTSVPIAVWLGGSWKERLLLWPAISGAAILSERFSARERKRDVEVGAEYFELPEETNNVLLREKARGTKDADRIN